MAFKLEHVHVKTKDPQNTAKFYMEALGATLIEATHENTRFRVDLHGVTLNISDHIAYQTRQQRYGLEHFAVQTDDLDGTIAKLKAKGARVLEQMISPIPAHKGMRICFLEGPEGVQLELIEVKSIPQA
jgi:catechol 2,3-dioxygenase-like lactoylglutathione lyase family enzyme